MTMRQPGRAVLTVFAAVSLVSAQQPASDTQGGGSLTIVVLEGEDGVNIIKKKTAVRPIVEVRDKNHLPIAGVAVIVGLGAAGVFDTGGRTVTIATDAQGRAVVPNFRPITKGPVNIQLHASYNGQTASVTVHQTNFTTAAQALKAGKTPGSSQSAQSASSSGSSSSAATAGNAIASSGGGMSGMAVVGIVGGVAAAGAGAAYASGALGGKDSSSSGPNCDSQLTSLQSALNALGSACSGTNDSQCQSAAQNVLNTLGQMCSCFGGSGLPAADQTFFQQVLTALQQEGFSTSQYASCGK